MRKYISSLYFLALAPKLEVILHITPTKQVMSNVNSQSIANGTDPLVLIFKRFQFKIGT